MAKSLSSSVIAFQINMSPLICIILDPCEYTTPPVDTGIEAINDSQTTKLLSIKLNAQKCPC